ncbi:NnrS family protein [Leeia sp.]|uniref:NnrS family protein n=1 Tax=Leeia sp. TaxID=2884678 RepID=UPI0035B18072
MLVDNPTPPSPLQAAWQRFQLAPHRPCFAAGVLAAVSLALWWWAMLQWPQPGHWPAVMVHGLMMPLGVFPLFMFGFIFTAGPRWLNVDAVTGLTPLAAAYLAGIALSLLGFALGGRAPLPGLLLMAGCWLWACWRWWRCIRASSVADRRHAQRLLLAFCIAPLTLLVAITWIGLGDGRWWLLGRSLALWAFLLPVFLVVSHRMLPFFTQAVFPQKLAWRPPLLLNGWLSASGLLALGSGLQWAWLEAAAGLLLAASLAYTSWRWGIVLSLQNRLLAMLHLSFAWLAPAVLLQVLGTLGVAVGSAPAHALGLGFCVTMLVGFVTRVSLGHSGQPLQADRGYWAIYLGLHGVAALRVLVALLGLAPSWLHAVSAAWLLLMLLWAARVLPIYWQVRLDGKPG